MLVNRGKWYFAPHLRILNDYLLRLIAGDVTRLIISMPPRHGKSEMISRSFPFWLLGNYPWLKVMLASYSAGFANSWQRKVRDLLLEFGTELFGIRPSRLNHGVAGLEVEAYNPDLHLWDFLEGGMTTAGVMTSMTGRGADVLLIDDPIKNAAEANSPIYRERTWEWFQSTAYTRLEKGGRVILVMTRWHQDDIAGRLIELGRDEETGERWHVLRLPAIGETVSPEDVAPDYMTLYGYRQPGEALWPRMFPREALNEILSVLGSYWFTAMYQGSPTPRSGGFFDRTNFKLVSTEQAPPFEKVAHKAIRYWDLAVKESRYTAGGDYTSGLLMAYHEKEWWIYNVDRLQGTPEQVYRRIEQRAAQDGRRVPVAIEQEPGAAGKSVPVTVRNRPGMKGYSVIADKPSGDKQLRAALPSAQVEAGVVNLVLTGDGATDRWVEPFLFECEVFPHGAHDDQVDSFSGAMHILDRRLRRRQIGGVPIGLEQRSRWKL